MDDELLGLNANDGSVDAWSEVSVSDPVGEAGLDDVVENGLSELEITGAVVVLFTDIAAASCAIPLCDMFALASLGVSACVLVGVVVVYVAVVGSDCAAARRGSTGNSANMIFAIISTNEWTW